jgi:hypothetical protein
MGSETLTNTIGIVLVSRITAAVAGVARVRMASRRSATSSLADALVGLAADLDRTRRLLQRRHRERDGVFVEAQVLADRGAGSARHDGDGLVGRPTETDLEVAALFPSKRDQHPNPEQRSRCCARRWTLRPNTGE